MVDIKQLYKTKELATFSHFKDGDFWYELNSGFIFPIPLSDLDGAGLGNQEQASHLVRYIRKHIEMLENQQT